MKFFTTPKPEVIEDSTSGKIRPESHLRPEGINGKAAYADQSKEIGSWRCVAYRQPFQHWVSFPTQYYMDCHHYVV